jgi:transposase-like protein
MYHPKCKFCKSAKTVKFGLPRWKCGACKRTFRVRRAQRVSRARIEAYVEDRATFGRLGKRWNVDPSTAYRRVMRSLDGRIPLIDRTRRLLALCDGVCLLDAKHVRVEGRPHTLFVAWDRGLGRPIHFILRPGGESETGYWRLLLDLGRAGYAPKAFVSDGVPTLKSFLAEAYPDLPHQRCTVHVFMAARGKAAPGRRSSPRQSAFVGLLRMTLWSRGARTARRRLDRILDVPGLNSRETRSLDLVSRALEDCFVCSDPRYRHLKLPRSSNAIENVMGQIEARLKTRRGAKSCAALKALVNDVLLRVKRQNINQ